MIRRNTQYGDGLMNRQAFQTVHHSFNHHSTRQEAQAKEHHKKNYSEIVDDYKPQLLLIQPRETDSTLEYYQEDK
jgi:hypothetical protein